MTNVNRWNLSHSRDGYAIHVQKVPAWVIVLEDVAGWACGASGGILGGHPRWGWMYTARTEKLWDVLHDLENKVQTLEYKYEKDAMRIPVTKEQAAVLSPDFFQESEELDNDDNV